ncbi:hypothetical protein [Vallicoccus soli]|uniref:hypothetical protein n=1 Tax=Vallicoccus soli TaxID=2339232 RepID=UPI0015ADC8ED|nr:hypothetical protein [Vallicoccus soli]
MERPWLPHEALTGAAGTFGWTAARHYDDRPRRRRAVRAGVLAGLLVAEATRPARHGRPVAPAPERHAGPHPAPQDPAPEDPAPEHPAPEDPAPEDPAPGLRDLPWPLVAAGLGASVAGTVLWHRAEDRWLRRLARRGHRSPAASLGLGLAGAQLLMALGAGAVARRRDARRG